MSLIGTLEHIPLTSVMLGLEAHTKTGRLVVKQETTWVELYFRDGRLMCIGPLRTDATLGDRLLQDGIITPYALQEVLRTLGTTQPGETRMALTLMDLGFVSREELRTWGTRKTVEVLKVLLSWTSGEIHFEDQMQTPPERLLVALSVQALLPSVMPPPAQPVPPAQPAPRPAAVTRPLADDEGLFSASSLISLSSDSPFAHLAADGDIPRTPPSGMRPDITNIPTMHDHHAEHSLFDTPQAHQGFPSTESMFRLDESAFALPSTPSFPQEPMQVLIPPRQVDTSFLGPNTVLVPADLSAFRQQNAQVQLSPDHWRLLTRVNGSTSLQVACQELGMAPENICQLAGELIALGLLHVTQQFQESGQRELPAANAGVQLASGLYAAPSTDAISQFAASSFETQSQWGNGGNGAKFIPGRGWITAPQPLQPLEPGIALAAHSSNYAAVGGQ